MFSYIFRGYERFVERAFVSLPVILLKYKGFNCYIPGSGQGRHCKIPCLRAGSASGREKWVCGLGGSIGFVLFRVSRLFVIRFFNLRYLWKDEVL